jgi:hypothetical protein
MLAFRRVRCAHLYHSMGGHRSFHSAVSQIGEVQRLCLPGSPLPRIDPKPYPSVKCRERPITNGFSKIVFHRVPMDIVEVSRIVVLVPDRMLPKPALPDTPLSTSDSRLADLTLDTIDRDPGFGELFFNPGPTHWVISISRRQSPDGVQVVWQENEGIDLERPPLAAIPKGFAEKLSGGSSAKNSGALFGDDGEEEGSSWDESSAVVGHEFWRWVGCAVRTCSRGFRSKRCAQRTLRF